MLEKFIRYTKVADRLFIDTFLMANKPIPQAEALFSHILNAQHIWICRINKVTPSRERFDILPVSAFMEIHNTNISDLETILATQNLNNVLNYTVSTGAKFESSVQDILLHVANHSTYHRAQVASIFKQNGVQPPVTDLVALIREGLL